MAPSSGNGAGQSPNLWEELNRPKDRPRPAPGATPPPPAASAKPAAPVAPKDERPPQVEDLEIVVERSAPARAIAMLDPEKLLLIGAVCFVVMSVFAIRGLGGGSSEPVEVEAADASIVTTAPEALAAIDSTMPEAPVSTLPARPQRSTMPPVTAPPEPMAMGLPAALLDTPQSQVYRLYRTALGREPDREGFAFWSDQIRADVPLERLAEEFLASEEYVEQFGGETGWEVRAELLIINAFGPPVDGPQMVEWLDRFRGLDDADLLLAISEADETLAATGTLR